MQRTEFITVTMFDEKTACSADFLDRVTKTCRSAKSFMQFIADAMNIDF